MLFEPNYQLNIIREDEFAQKIIEVERTLKECKNCGFFKSYDGKDLYYEYFLCKNSKGNVVIVHGLSEFTKKYYEMSYYLLSQGYNVFLYDQRCHGYSFRYTDEKQLIHVEDFNDYVKDLSVFIDEIVYKIDIRKPFIFAHSMGGAVAALYLAENSHKTQKAILSAPLFEPEEGVSHWLALLFTKGEVRKKGKYSHFCFSKEFNPNSDFNKSSDGSKARFEHNMKMRIGDENYQSTPMSAGWVYNSLLIKKLLKQKKAVNRISVPILLFSAELDNVVKTKPQKDFAKKCKNCTLEIIKGAKHTIFCGQENIAKDYMQKVIDFLA